LLVVIGRDSQMHETSRESELEILRERLLEYRALLAVSYMVIRDFEEVSEEGIQKYLEKLESHGIIASEDLLKEFEDEG